MRVDNVFAVAQSALQTGKPATGRLARLLGKRKELPARPHLDEGGLAAAIGADARQAAAATDANSVPGALPMGHLITAVMGATAKLGTLAIDELTHTRANLRATTTTARGLPQFMPIWQRVVFWGCLILLETVAMQKVLAEVLDLQGDLVRWSAAAALAGITAIAGIAVARSWHGAQPHSSEDPDGMVGRGLLRVSTWLVIGAVVLFAVGLVWVRVTGSEEASAGLLDEVPDMTGPHTVFITGLVVLSFTVSLALKMTELALDSRTSLRLTQGLQRRRNKATEMVAAALFALDEYILLETRIRELAVVAPDIWASSFLAALHPDTRDRWVEHLSEHPAPEIRKIEESAWVAALRDERDAILQLAQTLAMPAQDDAVDLVSPRSHIRMERSHAGT